MLRKLRLALGHIQSDGILSVHLENWQVFHTFPLRLPRRKKSRCCLRSSPNYGHENIFVTLVVVQAEDHSALTRDGC